MIDIQPFLLSLKERGKSEEILQLAEDLLKHFLSEKTNDVNGLDYTRNYCARYIADTDNAVNQIVILFWYHDFLQEKTSSTYLLTMLGTLGVLESQAKRLQLLHPEIQIQNVCSEIAFPKLGSDLFDYPKAIARYLDILQEKLSLEDCQKVLAGNHHELNPDAFAEDKERWLENPDLKTFLEQKHQRLVKNLAEHARSGKIWFEQYINDEVVNYVRTHQEIQTGVLAGKRIILQKIPYNPIAWLQEKDPLLKRYHACHCPFVRSAILQDTKLSDLWCYCSGGFSKLFFDYLFDCENEVELLESVLSGGECCKFAIHI